ncbi:MAG: glycosyltransferase family 4 protein [Anaerolineae bacterium]
MRRVGIDYTAAIRQSAGIGRYTRGLVRALAELDHESSYVLFSAGKDPVEEVWPGNFRLRAMPFSDRHMAIVWQRLRLPLPVELFTGRVEIFHSPDFVLPPVAGARTVLTVHDLSFMRYPECSSPPLLAYLMGAVPRSVRRADMVLADSESTRRDLIELLGTDPARVVVVYPGAEDRFRPGGDPVLDQAVLDRYGIQSPYILGLGTLQPRKNFRRLIEAFDMVRRRDKVPHQLVIGGGKGWLYDDIFQMIERLGLQDRVRMIGFVRDDDLPALYRRAAMFAFPSLYEGFGFPVLEAMGCGTPVVTSNTSSLPEAAGDAALLVPPEDVGALAESIGRLLQDQGLGADLREKGLRQVHRFTWRAAAEQLLEIYQRVAPINREA